METIIRDLKLGLAKEMLDPEKTYRMMQLTASIAMEIASITEIRLHFAHRLPVGNSKPAELQLAEALVFERVMASIDGKSNAEQRAAKMVLALNDDKTYQESLCLSLEKIKELDMHEAQLKGYKLEWQVHQEYMMNNRAAAALLEGITDIEVVVKKEKKLKKPNVYEQTRQIMEDATVPGV